ncbi:hypothetical protein MBAV_004859 [Candidatus Magnetobacterium bavaricum]|uniref:Uncharacterized protein n=1 Tax=Candidatus Magnetobacterium bavaricum TaxID=29290 RepID=A0A0F3GM33_9BACT|nr:hypothetical protein MBAV_004859 [Candidatus Magnetobacterium bavaricum]
MYTGVVPIALMPGMPGMVQELILEPDFFFAGIEEPEGHFVWPADITKVVNVLVSPADVDQRLAVGTHTRIVVQRVQGVVPVVQACGGAIFPIDAAFFYLIRGWIIKRVKSPLCITHLIQVQHNITVLIKGLKYTLYEVHPVDGIGIAKGYHLTPGCHDARVVHQVSMIHRIIGHVERQPLVNNGRFTGIPGLLQGRLYIGQTPAKILYPDDFVSVPADGLVIEVMEGVDALPR